MSGGFDFDLRTVTDEGRRTVGLQFGDQRARSGDRERKLAGSLGVGLTFGVTILLWGRGDDERVAGLEIEFGVGPGGVGGNVEFVISGVHRTLSRHRILDFFGDVLRKREWDEEQEKQDQSKNLHAAP